MSMFGVMFSGRSGLALGELVRVTRRGGRIVLANWTADGFVASMLRAHSACVPPPPGTPSPLGWGDETTMRRLLETHSIAIRDAQLLRRSIRFTFPVTPGGVVELFRECYGPSVRTFGALDADHRARLGAELLRLWETGNDAPAGSTSVAAEYLEVRIELA
jgi:hypothetical protein